MVVKCLRLCLKASRRCNAVKMPHGNADKMLCGWQCRKARKMHKVQLGENATLKINIVHITKHPYFSARFAEPTTPACHSFGWLVAILDVVHPCQVSSQPASRLWQQSPTHSVYL
jgi:hypothetical protein